MPAPKKGSPAWEKRQKQKADAIIWAEALYIYDLIARAVGLTDDTLKKWRDTDMEFSEQLEQARTRFLNKNIRKAKPEFVLERMEPKYFKQRMDVTSDDKPITAAVVEFVEKKITKGGDK